MHLIDEAVTLVAGLDEPFEQNFVRKHVEEERAAGHDAEAALYRVFAPKPGAYVDGVAQLIDHRNWESRRDIAEVYATWVSHAYTRKEYGTAAREQFVRRAGELDVVVKNRDNQEHDVFDTDDYFQDFGAMAATARELGGANTKAWVGDSTRPSAPAIRDAADEARRTFRRRAMNPRWIEGMKRHGYKGGSELLKTVHYAFGYDATMGVVEDWMYEGFAEQYLFDADTQEFLREHNPWAMRDMSERLIEAMDRGLWEEPAEGMRERLERLLLDADGEIEGRQEPVTRGGDVG
jgi:cobaltochelatase CobN